MKLTKEEEKLILDKRAEEDKNCAQKQGTLKEDLYVMIESEVDYTEDLDVTWLFSKGDCDYMISRFTNNFKKVASKGDKFVCFIENDGTESWYDEIYGIECMSAAWAEKYLTDIKPIKKSRRK